jgi:hypothetical protein
MAQKITNNFLNDILTMLSYDGILSTVRWMCGMKITASWRSSNQVVRLGVFLLVAVLITGIPCSYGGCGDDNHPSQNVEIRTWYDLNAVRSNLAGNHTLMNDLDSSTPGYEELASTTANRGKGWQPIVFRTYGFAGTAGRVLGVEGTFDGQGHEIRDLFIDRPDEDFVGLFGSAYGVIKDIGVVNATVTGRGTYSYSGGVGALVGANDGLVSNSYSTGNVSGRSSVGGLLGGNGGLVSNSYSTGNVSGDSCVGGLVGYNCALGIVTSSYSTASVSGSDEVGGLVGANARAVSNSYCTGRVTGNYYVGGLVGYNGASGFPAIVSDSYSSADVTGNKYVGGLVGENGFLWADEDEDSSVSNSYSAGNITGDEYVGGLVGWNHGGTATNSSWDTETSGQSTSAGGAGKTTAEMKNIATFRDAGWNIIAVGLNGTDSVYIWNIVDGVTYPFLGWQSTT